MMDCAPGPTCGQAGSHQQAVVEPPAWRSRAGGFRRSCRARMPPEKVHIRCRGRWRRRTGRLDRLDLAESVRFREARTDTAGLRPRGSDGPAVCIDSGLESRDRTWIAVAAPISIKSLTDCECG